MKVSINNIFEIKKDIFSVTPYHNAYSVSYAVDITITKYIDGSEQYIYDIDTLTVHISIPSHDNIEQYQGLEDRLLDLAIEEIKRRNTYHTLLNRINSQLTRKSKEFE